ncbi:unnamed protein product [Didymodactylos carnosus]|uniref:Tetratricopeptide repeat protein n=1 Tax=Didymodactylos carnosus TaxID=1234261 RepID=A0A815JFL3_9BILA|nr:unnamed protein product [Didymodactylos carnosus]CAF4266521.1 unnamed protein product [Didymodactylos carnosus]
MGENDRAEKYYRLLLEQLPSDHDDIAELYNNIGDVYQNIYVTAVENYYSKPLDLELKSEPDSHLFVTHTYTDFEDNFYCYYQFKTKQRNGFQLAIEIKLKSNMDLVATYNSIAAVVNGKWNYLEAIQGYKTALEIRL